MTTKPTHNGSTLKANDPRRYTFPKVSDELSEALIDSIRDCLKAHLPAPVYELVDTLECLCADNDMRLIDFGEHVKALEKAQWFVANGETVEETEARWRAEAESEAV